MKERHWHPVLIRACADILENIFENNRYADKSLEYAFKKNKKWGGRDRRFLAETVYDMVRFWRYLNEAAHKLSAKQDYILLWALYEVWKFQANPTEILKTKFKMSFSLEDLRRALEGPFSRAVTLSYPNWLYDLIQDQFHESSQGVMQALNQMAPVVLRANTLKTSRDELQKVLASEDVETLIAPLASDGLILTERKNVFITQAFKKGLFEVQDEASQLVAPLVDPQPGERVADACAGAGGKTLHLASLMKNKGTLLACDVFAHKLEELKIRARRAGVHNLRSHAIETSKDIKKHKESFDRVLVDVPCSGAGVIRRNPDSKWKLSPDELGRLTQLQAQILDDYSVWVKKGGVLVYATCSLLERENQTQVRRFIERHPEFKLEGEPVVTRPDLQNTDGFFAQRLRRDS